MQISELAKQTGVTVHALRHYERLGLLKPARLPNGYRDYSDGMRREVIFITMSRQIGLLMLFLLLLPDPGDVINGLLSLCSQYFDLAVNF